MTTSYKFTTLIYRSERKLSIKETHMDINEIVGDREVFMKQYRVETDQIDWEQIIAWSLVVIITIAGVAIMYFNYVILPKI